MLFGRKIKLRAKYDPDIHQFEALPKKQARIIIDLNLQNGDKILKYLHRRHKKFSYQGNTYLLDRSFAYIDKNKNLYYNFYEGNPLPVSHKCFEYEMRPSVSVDVDGNEITEVLPKLKGIRYDSIETDVLITRKTFDNYTRSSKTLVFIVIIVLQVVALILMGVNLYGVFR